METDERLITSRMNESSETRGEVAQLLGRRRRRRRRYRLTSLSFGIAGPSETLPRCQLAIVVDESTSLNGRAPSWSLKSPGLIESITAVEGEGAQ